MSGKELHPVPYSDGAVEQYDPATAASNWSAGPAAPPASAGLNLARYVDALKRYKWLIVVLLLLGTAGGFAATRFITPQYDVRATLLLSLDNPMAAGRGPIKAAELMESSGWQDLLKSFAIADPVVTKLALYLSHDPADSVVFRNFQIDLGRFRPDDYKVVVDKGRYTLTRADGAVVEQGNAGDSIGRNVGFVWAPPAAVLGGKRTLNFEVVTPREASLQLIRGLRPALADGSNFLTLIFNGTDPKLAARTLNALVDQFVATATDLKKRNLSLYTSILAGQTEYAQRRLRDAEMALNGFRTNTITMPSEATAITPGLEQTQSPVFLAYFNQKIAQDQLKRDLAAINDAVAKAPGGAVSPEALLSIPAINSDAAATNLKSTLGDLYAKQALMRTALQTYTAEYAPVAKMRAEILDLQTRVIPQQLATYTSQLKNREEQLGKYIDDQSKELKAIPNRAMQEAQLKREVELASQLYQHLNENYATAQLAEASTTPDVRVLDSAVAPLKPTKNTAPMIIIGAILGSLGLGIALAFLLDFMDKRVRYPEQVSGELQLPIIGVVPTIESRNGRRNPEDAAQVVEAFRSIRMNLRYATDPSAPLAITITSPGPNDGKSLISSNLALSFAESGARTLLIDGDTRRGQLHATFGITQRPGLIDYLEGKALVTDVLYPSSSHQNLTLLPCGTRRRQGPELLATTQMTRLISQLLREYDVVIMDSPPLGAGVDAYALAMATGNCMLVFRSGLSDRKMAQSKLRYLEQLPVRLIGAVMNGIKLEGVYKYYSYYQEYAQLDGDEEAPALPASGGRIATGAGAES
jgi:capsular exopolysaccharide synthesis family protein